MTSFNLKDGTLIKGGNIQLKPVIKKKEENNHIKSLRDTFRNTNQHINIDSQIIPNQNNNVLFNSVSLHSNRIKLEKLKLKKELEPVRLTGSIFAKKK